jgi:hypothetical protein
MYLKKQNAISGVLQVSSYFNTTRGGTYVAERCDRRFLKNFLRPRILLLGVLKRYCEEYNL